MLFSCSLSESEFSLCSLSQSEFSLCSLSESEFSLCSLSESQMNLVNLCLSIPGQGRTVTGRSGTIQFSVSTPQTPGRKYAAWLIQIPMAQPITITITKAPRCSDDGITNLDVYEGSTAGGGAWLSQYCEAGATPTIYEVNLEGPFATLVLATSNFKASGFTVQFAIKSPGNLKNTQWILCAR